LRVPILLSTITMLFATVLTPSIRVEVTTGQGSLPSLNGGG
jgi:hypothetical protein